MKVQCKYADCERGFEIDTNHDTYTYRGTGSYVTYAHYVCDIKHSKMNIPMTKSQVKESMRLIRNVYESEDNMPMEMLDLYKALEHYAK